MPSLPEDWGLTTKSRPDGKLDIIGKTDAGEDYKVRTTDGPGVTDTDIQELRAADREAYRNRSAGAREFVSGLVTHQQGKEKAREDAFMDDLTDAAGPVVHAALEGRNLTFGSTKKYRQNYESVFGEN